MVIVRTHLGEEGFMANHAWACKLLNAGPLWIQEAGSKEFKVASIAGGFIDVKKSIVIYTDAAEWPEDIDVERAESERQKAEEWLESPSEDPYETEQAKLIIAKSAARLKVKEGGGKRRK